MKPVQQNPCTYDAERNPRAVSIGSARALAVRRRPTGGVFVESVRDKLRTRIRAALLFGAVSALLIAATATGSRPARADEPPPGFRLITNVNNTTNQVSREFVSDIFLKKATRWPGGEPIQPFDLRFDAPVRRQFSSSMLRRSVAAVRSYWQQRIFSGRDVPPPEVESDEAMIRRVQSTGGGIGYVSERAITKSVKVIEIR